MNAYVLGHVPDSELLQHLSALVARDRRTTAEVLAHVAEVEERKLYLPHACSSMLDYCVRKLYLSEDEALKRLQAARVAREIPAIFDALASGRLHLTGVLLLRTHLNRENAADLLKAAAYRSKAEIQLLVARKFPQPDVRTEIRVVEPTDCQESQKTSQTQVVPEPPTGTADGEIVPVALPLSGITEPACLVATAVSSGAKSSSCEGTVSEAPNDARSRPPRFARVTPRSPGRFALQVTIGQETHDKLRHAQRLLGHQVPSGDVAQVLDRALDALIAKLEKAKLGATGKPRSTAPRASKLSRHVPNAVRRAVWERDGGQCTFASDSGERCPERARLEYDHATPVAYGGEATVENLRLRCQAHNQYAADCTFGSGFMDRKRRKSADRGRIEAEFHAREAEALERIRSSRRAAESRTAMAPS